MNPEVFGACVVTFFLTLFLGWIYHMHVCIDLEVKVNDHKIGERTYKASYDSLKEKYQEAMERIKSLEDDRRAALCKARDYENKISKVKAALDLKDGEFIAYTT